MKSKDLELAAARVANLRCLEEAERQLRWQLRCGGEAHRAVRIMVDGCGVFFQIPAQGLAALVAHYAVETRADLKAMGVDVENA